MKKEVNKVKLFKPVKIMERTVDAYSKVCDGVCISMCESNSKPMKSNFDFMDD